MKNKYLHVISDITDKILSIYVFDDSILLITSDRHRISEIWGMIKVEDISYI